MMTLLQTDETVFEAETQEVVSPPATVGLTTMELAKTMTDPKKGNKLLNYNDIDSIMGREQQKNKNDIWSKIDKSLKLQKLEAFAEKYGKEHEYSQKEIQSLNQFFVSALEKGKLQKTKDVIYNKETKEITNIPALIYDANNHNYTLKNIDVKRVSTLKSLTPRKN